MPRIQPYAWGAPEKRPPSARTLSVAQRCARITCGVAALTLVACAENDEPGTLREDSSVGVTPDGGTVRDPAAPGDDGAMDASSPGDPPIIPAPPGQDAAMPGTPNDAGTGPINDAGRPTDGAVPDAAVPPDAAPPPTDAGTTPDGGTDEPVPPGTTPTTLKPSVLMRYPHDKQAYTQGLLWSEGRLFESTGLEGQSTLREVTLATGAVSRRIANDADLFAEGLALVGTELIQLTWTEKRALVWNRDDFSKLREYTYTGEGWGLCYDGRELMMSSGTDKLTIRDAKTFAVLREVSVTRAGRAQKNLNELECVAGRVYANVWQTDEIVRIDPRTGAIDAVIDAAGLLTAQEKQGADVLNGIAYMPENGHFLLTGKRWPTLFEVVIEKSP
jgi:glutamine cyclotransferase